MNETKSRTVNRGWLRRQIEAGKIEIKTDMILTDDYAFDAAYNAQKSGWTKADIKNFSEEDFKYSSGRAYWNEDRTEMRWTMLANHYYTCRFIS